MQQKVEELNREQEEKIRAIQEAARKQAEVRGSLYLAGAYIYIYENSIDCTFMDPIIVD
jgi:hypothetical protein